MNLRKLIIGKTVLTSIVLLGTLIAIPHSLYADEVRIDDGCSPNQRLAEEDGYRIFYRSGFKASGRSYVFYAGRYQDGAVIVCLAEPGFKRAKRIPNSTIQNQYINKISKEPRRSASYLIVVAEGNDPIYATEYRLNLTNPAKPQLTKLRRFSLR